MELVVKRFTALLFNAGDTIVKLGRIAVVLHVLEFALVMWAWFMHHRAIFFAVLFLVALMIVAKRCHGGTFRFQTWLLRVVRASRWNKFWEEILSRFTDARRFQDLCSAHDSEQYHENVVNCGAAQVSEGIYPLSMFSNPSERILISPAPPPR